jgi:phosphohistidine phosphatase
MPKNLYLLRHAHSFEKQMGQSDKERELSPSGIKESLQIGTYLLKNKLVPEIIYTSTANRAKATTQLVIDTMKLDPEKISCEEALYDASVRTFLEFVNNIENHFTSAMCVGHNPVISYLCEYLTRAEIGDMPTGSLAVITFRFSSWAEAGQANGELVSYITPVSLQSS